MAGLRAESGAGAGECREEVEEFGGGWGGGVEGETAGEGEDLCYVEVDGGLFWRMRVVG